MIATRRSFLAGLAAVFAAPAIVRPEILMPIKPSLVPSPAILRRFQICGWSSVFSADKPATCELQLREVFGVADEAPATILDRGGMIEASFKRGQDIIKAKSMFGPEMLLKGQKYGYGRVTVPFEAVSKLEEAFWRDEAVTVLVPVGGEV